MQNLQRFLPFARHSIGVPESAQRFRRSPRKINRFLEMCDGLRIRPFKSVQSTQRKVSIGIIGIEFQLLTLNLSILVVLTALEVLAAPCINECQRIQLVGTFVLCNGVLCSSQGV